MRKTGLLLSSALVAVVGLCGTAAAQERAVIIKGFGAKSGVVRSFGINSEAAMRAAADAINSQGGVKLGDGTIGKIEVEFLDDRCTAEEGISVVRRIAAGPALVAIGPGCSNVAEPLFGVLQRKAGDASDSGLQFPIFTDVAIKGGLARISEWAFRNVPSEIDMYNALFAWLKTKNPELKTIFAGVEENFAHSRASWYAVMKEAAPKVGLEVKGEAKWLLEDTNFAQQVREIKAASPDILAIAAHPFTTCGVLKEMRRQGVKVKLLVGLTSSSSMETLQGCAREAEGIVIPTSFAPVTKEAEAAAAQAAKFNGSLDLHSAAAYENIFILKKVIEEQGVLAKPDTVQADREKIRKGLAALKETDGLLGKSKRTEDREAVKPYMYVHAKDGKWAVLFNPLTN
ncbi:ABC transporter substrate-binding protein [Vineibacter terrae]|uniref:ABC transporter substrate-binding protein n=1 Tax=Vineibacter terrae TaxID=2586908 RepID=UPI002E3583BE|nr:ABC transporter substrate-binding protein [Vineibacter terrae]HEX2890212.1 ABC transporter substrate-binding protein [Vineibacter terrae]